MKLDTTKIVLVLIVIAFVWFNFFKSDPIPEPEPITITIPEKTGTTGTINTEPKVERDTVYIENKIVQVDKKYKELYEQAKDSLEKQKLYNEAIQIKEYSDTLVDNDDITISGKATTRGTLLDYSVDYKIKPREITYIPEVVSRLPKYSIGLGLETGLPSVKEGNFVVKANLSIINGKGLETTVSYDTEKRVWVGAKIILRLKK